MLMILAESALRSVLLGSVVWIGLNLLQVQSPHVQMTSWLIVLVASLSMPLLMHWTTVSITIDALPRPSTDNLWPAAMPWPDLQLLALPSELGASLASRGAHVEAIDWLTVATAIYAFVAALLLLRLAVGLWLTWRLVRAARPMRESWTADWCVRVSASIAGPVTFGSTILLPPQYVDWQLPKRQAVLAHEGAHVANGDFYVLLLASLNRAVFWFNPFAWWQVVRLAELAEIISDARALEVVEDRLSYAQILLDLVQHVRRAPLALEMARACTVRARVERILATTALPAKFGWPKRIWTAAAIAPFVFVSAGSIAYRTQVPSTSVADTADATSTPAHKLQSASFYRLERSSILALFREDGAVYAQLGAQRKLRLAAAADGTYSYPAATGQISLALGDEGYPRELALNQNGRNMKATRIADVSLQGIAAPTVLPDAYTGWYQLPANRVLAVTRDIDRTYVQETGLPKSEIAARGADAFSGGHDDDLFIFLRDHEANVTQVLLHDPVSGTQTAPRIDAVKAKKIEEEFARRITEVPDRFKDQTPMAGSKEAILRGIADLQRGAPNYERMSESLAVKIRRDASQLQATFKTFGSVESIFFRGVGPGGYDIYGVKFANGVAEFRVLLAADGKAQDVLFRPDGNEAPGRVAACSDEQGLRSKGDNAPIKMMIYNDSGADIHLSTLDSAGSRAAQRTIRADTSSSIMTYVDSPWIVADSFGNCLEIVIPGQQTRFHSVESATHDQAERTPPPRTVPLTGSDEALRQYIDAMGRGEPDYDGMTPEVAVQTRRQLPFNQAILARLGALRGVSFRGVSSLGSDVYIAHFANGSAEWRIGLAKDGAIGRIALGPQY